MTLRAVVFDLGGVLELDAMALADHSLDTRWEARLGLQSGKLEHHMKPFWQARSVGACTEEEIHQAMREQLGMSPIPGAVPSLSGHILTYCSVSVVANEI